ncbi:hypothetical protein [uncultured Caulobacter sp.]|uniref:flagellar protein FlaG n=1 Tax=uncultured Caulobacter sp. TaxID=158749 RepID=UPI00260FE5A7|nr:hypothetical protein [uncultured Caulobacter sp.]
MEPKAALSAIHDFVASSSPVSTAPDPSVGANAVAAGAPVAAAAVPTPKPAEAAPAQPVDNGPQPGDLRLVIEQDHETGEYVYKTVDRRTGETLQQYPREQILKLRENARYAMGDVFDGKA